MIAAPADMAGQPHGGTWQTVRSARRASKPLAICYPDGSVAKERWSERREVIMRSEMAKPW